LALVEAPEDMAITALALTTGQASNIAVVARGSMFDGWRMSWSGSGSSGRDVKAVEQQLIVGGIR
jgi:hypothetical protein